MAEPQRPYRSFLLRLWQADSSSGLNWRASLEEALTGERWGFPDLQRLCAFLEQQTQSQPPPSEADEPSFS